MDKIANTLNIDLYAELSCPNVEYNVSIDEVGQITITPKEANCNFTNVSRELFDNNVAIHLVANMTSSDDNFDYFLDIDDIGQIIITPDSENSNFESVTEGADLNLVTESSHFKVVTECEDLDEDIEADGEPYTREQVEEDLRSLTMNWTRENTLKTGFEIEHQYAMEILSQHYDTVYDEGRKGNWYYVRFVGPMLNEFLNEDSNWRSRRAQIDIVKFEILLRTLLDGIELWDNKMPKICKYHYKPEFVHVDIGLGTLWGPQEKEENKDIVAKFIEPAFEELRSRCQNNNVKVFWKPYVGRRYPTTWTDYYAQLIIPYDQLFRDEFSDELWIKFLNEGNDNKAKEAFMNMFGDVEKQLDDLMGKWEDLKKNLEKQKREEDKPLDESKQSDCEKCGHILTDSGECPVCDLGDEEERTSHTIYDIDECLTTDSDQDQGAQLDESVSGKEAEEILRIAKQLGIETAADLIRFYEDHPAFDEHKLEEIRDYRDEVGHDFKLAEGARVSFDLDDKNYRGTYRGQSTTNPDMADVEIDDDQYENPDPYGRYINRRPIYNRHEDRYIKDGKFFIPHSELRFEDK